MIFTTAGSDLQKMLSNVIKFSVEKSAHLPGVIFFSLTNNKLRCYTTDDYVAFSDAVSVNEDVNLEFVLSLENAKSAQAYAKTNQKYDISVVVSDENVNFRIATDEGERYDRLPVSKKWDVVYFNLHDENVKEEAVTHFAFSYERLQKFYALGVKAPIDFKSVLTDHAGKILRFKIGENILGCISPLRREVVAENNPEFLWEDSY